MLQKALTMLRKLTNQSKELMNALDKINNVITRGL